jgi:hypothetical protein
VGLKPFSQNFTVIEALIGYRWFRGLYLYFGLDAQAVFRVHPGHEQLTAFI